ncbi:hypothetical protein BDA96_10G038600 [Sorghum bicolor]|uniref:CCHC-type domain-containing protein n=1 Tax=Sorghum bicolor TaxID=4558 RepID=A0A921TZJ4_SORBI|nr:hypothetical protein BDA96_10G038600 [Sorghum bicolor]
MDPSSLNPRPGISIQKLIRSRFNCSVSPVSRSHVFFLVASFGHCKLRLSAASVGAVIQATIGGYAADFDVLHLNDRVFRFSVSSKKVGFHIVSLRSFECSEYKIFFHLWGMGGPNWKREWSLFCSEEVASWTKIQRHSRKSESHSSRVKPSVSFAQAVKSNLLTGANSVPMARRSGTHVHRVLEPQGNIARDRQPIGSVLRNPMVRGSHNLNLNNSALGGQTSPANNTFSALKHTANLFSALRPGFCSRCLSPHHVRALCKSRIRCFACREVGHIATHCRSQQFWGKSDNGPVLCDTVLRLNVHNSDVRLGPANCAPKQSKGFQLFGAWVGQQTNTSQRLPRAEPIEIALQSPLTLDSGTREEEVHIAAGKQTVNPIFRPSGDSCAPTFIPPADCINNVPTKPQPVQCLPHPSQHSAPTPPDIVPPIMAYQRANPALFKPRGMMVRTMAHRRPRPRNEDLAIVTIHPIPGNVLHFPVVEEVIRECCASRRARVSEVQKCPLGQAFVRFEHEYDRDRMVSDSPHLYGGSHFTFVKHNQGRNWRSLTFNHECWVMMLGLPEDYWEDEFIESCLGPFARIIDWHKDKTEADTTDLSKLLVKARVVDLENIPHFSVFSDGLGLNGQSWSVQCEILQHEFIGPMPPDEEQVPPPPPDGGPPMFDFFGLGQPLLAPVPDNGQNIEEQDNQNEQHQDHELPGPAGIQVPQQLNLNIPLQHLDQDLNDFPDMIDPLEMIINPAQGIDQEDVVLQIANPPRALMPMTEPEEEPFQMPTHFPVMQVDEEELMNSDELQSSPEQEFGARSYFNNLEQGESSNAQRGNYPTNVAHNLTLNQTGHIGASHISNLEQGESSNRQRGVSPDTVDPNLAQNQAGPQLAHSIEPAGQNLIAVQAQANDVEAQANQYVPPAPAESMQQDPSN